MTNTNEERYRRLAMVGKKAAPYASFVIAIVEGRRKHKVWLLHHGLVETWVMIEDERT